MKNWQTTSLEPKLYQPDGNFLGGQFLTAFVSRHYHDQELNFNNKTHNPFFKISLNAVSKLLRQNLILTLLTHETNILTIDQNNREDYNVFTPECIQGKFDAILTNVPNVPLGIVTADCLPVTLYCPDINYVAILHCGWRSAFGGINHKIISQFKALGSTIKNIKATFGPCIGTDNYEVQQDFVDLFIQNNSDNIRYFNTNGHRTTFNLRQYNVEQYINHGITNLCNVNVDTLTSSDFYSHRNGDEGRFLSFITLL